MRAKIMAIMADPNLTEAEKAVKRQEVLFGGSKWMQAAAPANDKASGKHRLPVPVAPRDAFAARLLLHIMRQHTLIILVGACHATHCARAKVQLGGRLHIPRCFVLRKCQICAARRLLMLRVSDANFAQPSRRGAHRFLCYARRQRRERKGSS